MFWLYVHVHEAVSNTTVELPQPTYGHAMPHAPAYDPYLFDPSRVGDAGAEATPDHHYTAQVQAAPCAGESDVWSATAPGSAFDVTSEQEHTAFIDSLTPEASWELAPAGFAVRRAVSCRYASAIL